MSCENFTKVTFLAGLSLQTNFSILCRSRGSVFVFFSNTHNSSMYDYTRKLLINNLLCENYIYIIEHKGYLASFPDPAQLSVASAWGEPGNEAKGYLA